jgi:hypothetical protein
MNIVQWELLKRLDELDPSHKPRLSKFERGPSERYDWPANSKIHGTVIMKYDNPAFIKIFCPKYPDCISLSLSDGLGHSCSYRKNLEVLMAKNLIRKLDKDDHRRLDYKLNMIGSMSPYNEYLFEFQDIEELLKEIVY